MSNQEIAAKHLVWLEEYGCGCSFVAKIKRDLPGYCERHGDNRIHVYRVEAGIQEGHSE